MSAPTRPPPAADLTDLADTVAELVEGGLAREAEVTTAALALWLLDRVTAGRTSRDEANLVFATLDARLTGPAAEPLSRTWRDLVTEGEHFHHFGEEWGTDPEQLRALALAILRGEQE